MTAAVRFAQPTGPVPDHPLDANGVGGHKHWRGAKHVRPVGSREGVSRHAASRHRGVPRPRALLVEPVDDRLRLNRRTFVGASLAVGGAVAAGPAVAGCVTAPTTATTKAMSGCGRSMVQRCPRSLRSSASSTTRLVRPRAPRSQPQPTGVDAARVHQAAHPRAQGRQGRLPPGWSRRLAPLLDSEVFLSRCSRLCISRKGNDDYEKA
jgi:hypothetical protein